MKEKLAVAVRAANKEDVRELLLVLARASGSAVLSEIAAEVARAMRKFPRWPTDPIHAAAVIAEECGELQQAVLEAVYEPHKGSRPNIRTEAIQTAAMCLRFLASMNAYVWFHAEQHTQNARVHRPTKAGEGTES